MRDDLHGRADRLGVLDGGADVEGHHRPHPGIAHGDHRRVVSKAGGEDGSVGARPLQTQVQGAYAAQRQPGLQGTGDRTVERPVAGQRGEDLVAVLAHHAGAEDHIAVATQVLGHRMHDQVRAQLEGSLGQGGGEGVVDDGQHTSRASGLDEGLEIGDLEQGVGGRLQPDQVRAREGVDGCCGVGEFDGAHGQLAAFLPLLERRQGAVVGRVRGHDDATDGHQRERCGDRGHPAAEDEGPATLEGAQRLLECRPGGIAVARVVDRTVRGIRAREHQG